MKALLPVSRRVSRDRVSVNVRLLLSMTVLLAAGFARGQSDEEKAAIDAELAAEKQLLETEIASLTLGLRQRYRDELWQFEQSQL